jgi:SAM-dependent methyltransferase
MLNRLRRLTGRHDAPDGDPSDGQPAELLHHFDEPALPLQPGAIAVPNRALRAWAGTADLAAFLGIGEAWAQLIAQHSPAEPLVLDLGCGCGKLARYLHLNPRLRYVGVDLFEPAIAWCRRAFAGSADRFRFEHFDGYSATYNPTGRINASEYRLPVDDGAVDLVACGSLFTHLLEPDARHYLAELRRVLRPTGCALVSLHVEPAAGSVYSGDENRIDVDEAYWLMLAKDAGLRSADRIGLIYGQVVHRLARA